MTDQDPTIDKIIKRLASEKPQVSPDNQFARNLRENLHSHMGNSGSNQNPIINLNFMNKFKYLFASAAVVAVVALIFFTAPKNQTTNLIGQPSVTRLQENAFGSLATLTVTGKGGQGGGGSDTMSAAPTTAVGMGGGGGGVSSDTSIYLPTNYKFVYKGEEISVVEDKMAVYERQKGFGSTVDAASILNQFSIGSFDISKFSNARLDYITASQNTEFGYMLNLDMREGYISIGQNWEKWPNVYASCQDQGCYERLRIKPEQIPADDNLIAIANQFLDAYGIDRSAFGAPYVQNTWRLDYQRAADKSMFYVPDMINVIYPTKIEGHEIYDQGGNKSGMYVNVDIRNQKVSGAGEIHSQRYQSSDYETEKDTKKILSLAEKGGYQNYFPITEDASAKTVEVDLGTPIQGYVRLWQMVNNQNKDLYVPSLIFPITNSPENFYGTNIIVPIIKDVLDAQQNVPPYPIPMGGVEKMISQ